MRKEKINGRLINEEIKVFKITFLIEYMIIIPGKPVFL